MVTNFPGCESTGFKLDMAVVVGQGTEVVVDLGTGVGVDWRGGGL